MRLDPKPYWFAYLLIFGFLPGVHPNIWANTTPQSTASSSSNSTNNGMASPNSSGSNTPPVTDAIAPTSDTTETAATAGGSGPQLPNSINSFETDLFSGSLNYQVPIVIAPARGSSQPKIALSYNSHGGNGWCGVGWSLEMGYIERDSRLGVPVLYPTNVSTPVQYDDSKGFVFSLNGMNSRLVQDSNSRFLYHAHVEGGFLQFVKNGERWTVTDKNGTTYQFGQTGASRQQNPSFVSNGGGESTFHWALDQIVDANGNTTSLTYSKPSDDSNHLYLSQIDYNGNNADQAPTHSVVFSIESRTDDSSNLKSGFPVHTKYRLNGITVNADSHLVRRYALQYSTSEITYRSLLTNVTQYGNDNRTSLPPLTFAYQSELVDHKFGFAPPIPWTNVDYQGNANTYNRISANSTNNVQYVGLIDMDRDGLPDRVMRTDDGSYDHFVVQRNMGLANGTGSFASSVNWGSLSNYNGGGIGQGSIIARVINRGNLQQLLTQVYLTDLDGDGLPDRILQDKTLSSDNNNWYLQLSTAQSPSIPFDSHGIVPLADSVGAIQITNTTTDSNGNPVFGNDALDLVDMNGDGLPDRVRVDSNNNFLVELSLGNFSIGNNAPFDQVQRHWGTFGSIYFTTTSDPATGAYDTNYGLYDMNGDGLPDNVSSSGVAYNNGYGTGEVITYPNQLGSLHHVDPVGGTRKELIDMNGDGLLDYVSSDGTDKFMVQLGTGTGFREAVPYYGVSASFSQNAGGRDIQGKRGQIADMIDIDGDGLLDRVIAEPNQPGTFMVQLNMGPYPDLLIGVQNGIGGQISASYTPSTKFDNHNDAGMGTLSNVMYLVTQTVKWDGVNATSQIKNYSYSGGFYSFLQKEFRGFHRVETTDSSSDGAQGMTTVTYFHQGDPGSHYDQGLGEGVDPVGGVGMDVEGTQGIPFRVEQYYGSGSTLTRYLTKLNHVTAHDAGNGNIFPYIDSTITQFYGGTGSSKDTAQQYFYDLTNGNLIGKNDFGWVNVTDYTKYQYASVANPTNYPTFTGYTYDPNNPANPAIKNRPASIVIKSGTDAMGTGASGSALLRGVKMTYDDRGNLITRSKYWDTQGTYVQDLSLHYDKYGNVSQQTDATGVTTATTQLDSDNMYPIEQKLGDHFIVSAAYDAATGKATSTTGLTGLVTNYKYDVFYRLKRVNITPPGGDNTREVTYAYSSGNPTINYVAKSIFYNDDKSANPASPANTGNPGPDYDAISLTGNALTTFSYSDGFGRPTQSRALGEDGTLYRVVHTIYDDLGRKAFVSDPVFESGSGYINYTPSSAALSALGTMISYDHFNRVIAVTPAAGNVSSPTAASSVIYNRGGDPWAITTVDAKGKKQGIYHNAHGDIVQVAEIYALSDSQPGGGTPRSSSYNTLYAYDPLDQLTKITNTLGHVTTLSYDSLGNKRQTVDPNMGTWNYTYDLAGRLITQVDAKQQQTVFHYGDAQYPDPNQSSRLTAKCLFDDQGSSVGQVLFTYDVASSPDLDPNTQYMVGIGQLAKVQDLQGAEYYSYDNRGRLAFKSRKIAVHNTQLYKTTLAYDNASRVTSVGYPLGMANIQYHYDTAGNLISVATPNNSTVFYSASGFDAFGDPAQENLGDGSTTTYDYYAGSKRLKRITSSSTVSALQQLQYSYDQSGQITSITDAVNPTGNASGAVSSVGYDDLYRMTSITTAALGTKNYAYDAIGRITQNGDSSHTYTYDDASSHPQAIKTFNELSYTYDLCGNRTTTSADGGATTATTYEYDTENQLTRAYGGASRGVPNNYAFDTSFGYDFTGARLWKRNKAYAYTLYVDGLYEYRAGKDLYHIYANGSRVCTYEPSSSLAGNFIQNHQMLARATTSFYATANWIFHTQGRLDLTMLGCIVVSMVSFLVWIKINVPLGTGQKQFQTRAGPKRWTRRFLLSLQQVGACILAVVLVFESTNTARAAGATYDPVFYFYHQDHLGSSTVITDQSGNLVQQYGYAPYGALNYQANTQAFSLSNLFTGQEYDDDTGLYYYGSRYYDPTTATFIQPDTEVSDPFNPQSLNRYSYVLNNPLNSTDPSGHDAFNLASTAQPNAMASFEGIDSVDQVPDTIADFGYGVNIYPGDHDLTVMPEGSRVDGMDLTPMYGPPSPPIALDSFLGSDPSPAAAAQPVTAADIVSHVGSYLTSAQGISTVANLASALPFPGVSTVFSLIGVGADIYQGNYGSAAIGVGGAVLGLVGAGSAVAFFKFGREVVATEGVAREVGALGQTARELSSAFGGPGAARLAGSEFNRLPSLIKNNTQLVKEAEEAGLSVQKSLDDLAYKLAQGNMTPGIGTKRVFGDIFEARARDGARLYFRQRGGAIEIVGKSTKANQGKVISLLQKLYGN